MDTRRTIIPAGLEAVYTNWHFAPAVVRNGMIYCSGIIGTRSGEPVDGAIPGDAFDGARATLRNAEAPLSALLAVDDPERQFVTAFEALRLVLSEAGAGLGDIVELVTYHVEIGRHMETFMKVKDRYVTEPYPAWTAVGVSELIVPGGLVELRALAALSTR